MLFDKTPVRSVISKEAQSAGGDAYSSLGERYSLALDFSEYEPAVVPAARACGVTDNLPFGLVKTLRAEGIVLRHATKFAQEVIRVNIMGPGTGHGFRDVGRMVGREEFLDSA